MKPISIIARGTMAALTLLLIGTTACTDSHDPLNPDQGTLPAAGVTSLIAAKPGYTPLPATTRTATTDDGAWLTGDQVRATISFYADAESNTPTAQPAEQTLTYTAPSAANPGLWTAAPAVVPIAPAARSMRVAYHYFGLPDPLTATREQIAGHVTHAKGTAIRPNAPEEAFAPTDADNRLIPIANVTGTLALSVAFERRSALVSLVLQPGQTVHLSTATAQPDITPGSDNLYLLSAAVPATATAAATAHFHLQATDATTFTLRLKGVEKTVYKDLPLRTGWKYAIDARNITSESGSGGGNQQFVTASGMQPLDTKVFNADNPVWIITGGADSDADAEMVATNVRGALPAGTSNIELVLADVKTVGNRAFNNCAALATISLPQATSIGNDAFFDCAALTTITLPQATDIGEYAFFRCAALTTISLPQATSIGDYAFNGCTALTDVSLPQATTIGEQAFNGCAALTTISLPQAKSIGNRAFNSCTALTTISLPQATGIGNRAFNSCTALTTISLPQAKSIEYSAFSGCKTLATATLPQAESIGQQAFNGCAALTTISLPQAESIGNSAFASCAALTTISLPAATGIGNYAFYNCAALTRLELSAAGTIKLDAEAFFNFDPAACTLVLNPDKKADDTGDATPKVTADGKWGATGKELTWKSIEHLAPPVAP